MKFHMSQENMEKKAVVIGGKTAMEKAKEYLIEGIRNSHMEISNYIWFGGDSNYENVEMLKKNPDVLEADMLFVLEEDVHVIL